MLDQDALNRFKETILKDYPKLSLKDKFKFSCYKGISCFNQCCKDVNIFLTPYDILRMKINLNIKSEEFLEKYTTTILLDDKGLLAVLLKMKDDEEKTCPFVTEEGCSIYEDRPWSCRMYPLGMASPNKSYTTQQEFHFLVTKEDFPFCVGLDESKEWTVKEYRDDQGIDIYDVKAEAYKGIVMHDFFQNKNTLKQDQAKMFYMACYNLDTFRSFIFDSSFLDKFEVDDKVVERIKEDDEALLDFTYSWLRFSLFREPTIGIKDDAVEKTKDELGLTE